METNYNVFINCPFDKEYKPIFDAIVFTVFDCGYLPRCALEVINAGQVRIEKINLIIEECKYGFHDISRTELDDNDLPRFNMPLELGIFLGAQRFGNTSQSEKVCFIVDREQYRYQKFISDISGQDIYSHNNNYTEAVKLISNWLRSSNRDILMPGGNEICKRFEVLKEELPEMCREILLDLEEVNFNDYCALVSSWLEKNSVF